MNKAVSRAIQILRNIHHIPGYSGNHGDIVITISQHNGSARSVDVTYRTVERADLVGGSMKRVVEKKVDITNFAI